MSRLIAVGLMFGALFTVACSESSHDHDHGEHDVVTRITLALVPSGTTDTVRVTWDDSDGPGGQPPTIDTLQLLANTTYTGEIRIYNATITPVEDLTSTIVSEGDQHQFFFSATVNGIVIMPTDQDVNGLPIGQQFRLITGAAGTGSVGIDLSHYDDPAKKDGQMPSDETDISIDLPAVVN